MKIKKRKKSFLHSQISFPLHAHHTHPASDYDKNVNTKKVCIRFFSSLLFSIVAYTLWYNTRV